MKKFIKLITLTIIIIGISACGKTGELNNVKTNKAQTAKKDVKKDTKIDTAGKTYCFSGNCFPKPEGKKRTQQVIAPELDILPHNSK
jgi:predicted small lipoprotein YifL